MAHVFETKTGWRIFGPPVHGRSCGDCQACCVAVPVDLPGGRKPAGIACEHQCATGCAIYERRPRPCEAWSCTWLFHPDTVDLGRPDQSGYLIDPMPQTILIDQRPTDGVQVWIDPERPEAHRDPQLRAWLSEVARKHRMVALIRWSHPTGQEGADAMVLIAPCMSEDGEWIENHSQMISEEAMAGKLGGN